MDIEVELDELHEYLAVPYVAVIYSVETDDGEWVRRAEYPELGCAVEAEGAREAIDLLEEARVRTLLDYQRRGETPPRPRPPLRSGASGLSPLPVEDLLAKVLLGDRPG